MTSRTRDHLERIDASLQRLERHLLIDLLRPGASAAEVRAKLKAIKLASNEELEALYGWHDGLGEGGTIGEISLFPGFYLCSLDEAVANYKSFVRDSRWRKGWLPVFANGGGDFYVVDLGAKRTAPVRHFRIDESEHPIEFLSLSDMLGTIAEGFERGLFLAAENGSLTMDYVAFASLAAELNPSVPWWVE